MARVRRRGRARRDDPDPRRPRRRGGRGADRVGAHRPPQRPAVAAPGPGRFAPLAVDARPGGVGARGRHRPGRLRAGRRAAGRRLPPGRGARAHPRRRQHRGHGALVGRRRRDVPAPGAAARGAPRRRRAHRRAGRGLPGDRRPLARGLSPRGARRSPARAGALAGLGLAPPPGVGVRPVLPDLGEPGRPAARLQRRHPRLPLVRARHRPHDGLQPPARRRRARAAPVDRHGPAGRRRRQPRQPVLR